MRSVLVFVMLLAVAIPQIQVAGAAPPERWTVLCYMCGDSTLESYLLNDLNELEKVGSTSDVNILVQMDRVASEDDGPGDWTDARRFRVLKDASDDGEIRSQELEVLGEVNMADPSVLRDFLEWGIESYPSDHYMLTVGGHGDGPAEGMCRDSTAPSGSSIMTLDGFGSAVRGAGARFDVVSLDLCWMGTAESAFEMVGYADYFIGSFDEVPAKGWPYDICIPLVVDGSRPLSERLGSVVSEYMDSLDVDGSEHYATLSVVDLDSFSASLVPAWAGLSDAMFYTAFDKGEVYKDIAEASGHSKRKEEIIDLFDLAKVLSGSSDVPRTVSIMAGSLLAMEDDVLIAHQAGSYHSDSSAFGIYHPLSYYSSRYSGILSSEELSYDDYLDLLDSGIDARPKRINWTATPHGTVEFTVRTTTSSLIRSVDVEVGDGVTFQNHTCSVSSGMYAFTMDRDGRPSFQYRYHVRTVLGSVITFPPDGYATVRFEHESVGPSLLHWPPPIVDPTEDGLISYVSDDTGVDLGKSAMSFRVKGGSSYYSSALQATAYDAFTGMVTAVSKIEWIEAGSTVEYYFSLRDVLGNPSRYPANGHYETAVGNGKLFLIDSRHSSQSGYEGLLSLLNSSFIIGEESADPLTPGLLSAYDGYLLLEPTYSFTSAEVQSLQSFYADGGDVLLVMDPGSGAQMSVGSSLLEMFHLGPGTFYGGGVLSSDPDTVLGSPLPVISTPEGGTFDVLEGAQGIYFAPGAGTVLATSVQGKGRSFTAVPDLFSDAYIGRAANRALASKVLSTLSANAAPLVEVSQSPAGVVEPGENVVFDLSGSTDPDGTIAYYSMRVQGSYSESPSPRFERIFDQSGLYTIAFSATDSDGAVSTATWSVTANRPPSVEVGISGKEVHAGEPVIFDFKGSDPDGDPISIEWDFADGYKSGSLTAYHTYKDRGIYNVTLTVTDSYKLESFWKGTVSVLNSDPVAMIDRDLIMVNEREPTWTGPQKVTLEAFEGDVLFITSDGTTDADEGDLLNISWKVGPDAFYGNVLHHTLKEPGLLTIVLRVDDGHGGIDEVNLTVHVINDDPLAMFTVKGKGSTVEFSGQAIDDPWDLDGMEYRWDFGDGRRTTTLDPDVRHRYTFGGRYTVNLTVVDADGGEGYYQMRIESGGITLVQAVLLLLVLIGGTAGIGTGIYFYLKGKMVREDRGLVDMIGKDQRREPIRPTLRSFSGMEKGKRP